MINVCMKEYENYMRDERQWKADTSKIYNLIFQHYNQGLKEELAMVGSGSRRRKIKTQWDCCR